MKNITILYKTIFIRDLSEIFRWPHNSVSGSGDLRLLSRSCNYTKITAPKGPSYKDKALKSYSKDLKSTEAKLVDMGLISFRKNLDVIMLELICEPFTNSGALHHTRFSLPDYLEEWFYSKIYKNIIDNLRLDEAYAVTLYARLSNNTGWRAIIPCGEVYFAWLYLNNTSISIFTHVLIRYLDWFVSKNKALRNKVGVEIVISFRKIQKSVSKDLYKDKASVIGLEHKDLILPRDIYLKMLKLIYVSNNDHKCVYPIYINLKDYFEKSSDSMIKKHIISDIPVGAAYTVKLYICTTKGTGKSKLRPIISCDEIDFAWLYLNNTSISIFTHLFNRYLERFISENSRISNNIFNIKTIEIHLRKIQRSVSKSFFPNLDETLSDYELSHKFKTQDGENRFVSLAREQAKHIGNEALTFGGKTNPSVNAKGQISINTNRKGGAKGKPKN